MVRRTVFLNVALALLTSFSFAQIGSTLPDLHGRGNNMSPRFANSNASLQGMVVNAMTNKPLQNARVELRDPTNGTVVNSAYTGDAGSFQFGAVTQGTYQIVAYVGVASAEDRVDVSSFNAQVTLRVPINDPSAQATSGNTVSVAQYKVPDKARDEFQKAQAASTKISIEDARKHLARALEIFPNYADALTLRAILNLSGDTAAAVADLEKAIQCDASYALAYTVLGSAYNQEQKFDQAIQTLQHGQSLSPDSWQGYFELARSYVGKMDFNAALQQLERAQSLVPAEYLPIRLVRAQALLGLKNYAEAVTNLETYLQKDPNGPNTGTAQQMLQQAKELMARK